MWATTCWWAIRMAYHFNWLTKTKKLLNKSAQPLALVNTLTDSHFHSFMYYPRLENPAEPGTMFSLLKNSCPHLCEKSKTQKLMLSSYLLSEKASFIMT